MSSEFELSVNEHHAKEVKDHFELKGFKGLQELMVKRRDEWIEIPIHVALSGSLGAGKSSFINAIRGIKAEDKNGAALNSGTTTIEPIPYSHPNKHYLKFWDLPQLGSRAFSKDKYLQNVNFHKYDFFLILTKTEFTESDFWFAQEIQKAKKRVFFVRTNFDVDVSEALQKAPNDDPRDVQLKLITAINGVLLKSIKDAKIKADKVYVITNTELRKFDFPNLVEEMINELPEGKWEALALTLSVLGKGVIHQKRRALQKRVWIIAIMSMLEGACHVYGLPYELNIEVVNDEVREYRRQFSLDDASILRVAGSINSSMENLKKASSFKTNYSHMANDGLLSNYKTLSVYDVSDGITKSFSPILGSLITGNSSFGSTYHVLNKLLDMMENDALKMIEFVRYRNAEI